MRTKLSVVITVMMMFAASAFSGSGPAGNNANHNINDVAGLNTQMHSGEVVPGKYIVVLKDNTKRGLARRSVKATTSIALSVGVQPRNVYSAVLEGFSGTLTNEQYSALLADPAVDFIEPDRTITMYAQSTPWGISQVQAPAAHARNVKGSGVKVAIVDTGIDYTHPDLAGNYAGGTDIVNNDNDPMDDNGHGTHVSGTVAAIINNIDVVGVAPSASLYGVKVLNSQGSGTFSGVIAGIDWAAANGMDVINMSLGASSGSAALQQSCDNAYASGVVICGANGNDYGWPVGYPAKYSSVIAVSALDQNNNLAYFSNVGPETEVAAPGVSITSTALGGGTTVMSGTSMACPHAAGVAALVWSTGQYTTASAVRNQMTSTCTDLGPNGRDNSFGYGLLNADAATAGGGNPAPVADFSGSPTSGCAPMAVSFSDLSTNATSWSWDFGDGGTSTAQNPSYTYNSPGTYSVSLTATGAGGSNTNTKNGYITVTGAPTAGFAGSPTSGTEPLTVGFTNQSSGATSYGWDFGDGGTSTASNPNYTYNLAGTYTVTLTATNSCGSNQKVRTNYITVNPCVPPTASFVGTPTSGTEPLTVSFTDQSTGASSWSWDFGDASTSTQQNPSHTYNAAGTYTVTLTATNGCGSNQSVQTNYITVNPCVVPTAGFAGTPTLGDAPLAVSFTDQSSGATSWAWDFGDGGTSTAQNPAYTYNTPGTYTVTQTVTNACGSNQSVLTNYVTVNTPPCSNPVAGFSGTPTSGNAPLTVGFTDQSSNAPTSWNWDFGDGGTSTQQNPNYTYNTAGTYSVTLTATNSCGSDQLVQTNYITVNSGPVTGEGFILSRNADFSTDDRSFNLTETIYMKVWTDQVDYTNLKKNRWELKDANKNKVRNPFTVNMDNTYTASFALSGLPSSASSWTWKGDIQDNAGAQFRPTTTITVSAGPPPSPVADFSGSPTSGFAPLAVSFTDLSTNSPTSWAWDFGDGGSSTAQNPNYTYNTAGTYTVSLTATNGSGSNQMVKTGYITASTCTAPVAGFAGTPTSGNAPLTVAFTDQSTGATSWSWSFGDGGTSTAQNPNYTYNSAGTYSVTLTATNSCGSDQMVKTNYVTVNTPPCNPPVAGFAGSPTTGNAPLAVSFTDQTTNSPTSWNWDFGDGGTSTAQNPSYSYGASGQYTVTLSVTNACGSDQLVQTNYITVNAGGPVTGQGFILSRNPDFSTDDRTFARSETVYMKLWTDQVDYNNLSRSRYELKDANKNKVRNPLTNNMDNTYTAAFALSGLPSAATSWTWKGEAKDNAGNRYKPSTQITVTGVAKFGDRATPIAFELTQNTPNPFNPSTVIGFSLPVAAFAKLEVYNVTGRKVATLVDASLAAGRHSVNWDASNYPSGIYFYRLTAGDYVDTQKMILLK